MFVDRASPALLKAVSTGQRYPDAVLTVRKAGDVPVEYMKYSLTEVLVTALSTGGSGGEDRLTQNITLNFAHFKYEYTQVNAKGTSSSPIAFEFDIKTDKVVLG